MPVLVMQVDSILAPVLAIRDELEVPAMQRMERVRPPDTSVPIERRNVGMVFQSFNLVPTLTASENITLPSDLAGAKIDKAWFDYLVGALGIADRLSHRPSELSGGQQQRVACARALIRRPELIFADEPTGNLDSSSSGEVLGFLRSSVDEHGQSIVMVTHDPRGAAYADRVVFLADGRLVGELASPTADSVLELMMKLGN